MCYYLNVHFQGQRVTITLHKLWQWMFRFQNNQYIMYTTAGCNPYGFQAISMYFHFLTFTPVVHTLCTYIMRLSYIKNIFSFLLYQIWNGISAVMDYDVGLLLHISSIGCNLFIAVQWRFALCVLVPLVLFSSTSTFLRNDGVQNI